MQIRECSEPYALRLAQVNTERKRLDGQIEKAQARIERLQKKRSGITYPDWVDELIRPIAEALLSHMEGFDRYEILGPFGICCSVSIHFGAVGTDIQADRETYFAALRSITFTPGDLDKGELCWRDESVNTQEFAPDTLGEMNGMNHPQHPIDPESDVLSLLDRIH